MRRLTKTMLEELGYRVISAADGEEAVRLFSENPAAIDLLLMDVIMPKQNGKQAYDEIRKIRPDVKVLFTSGYTSDVITSRGLLEQDMDFMAKPSSCRPVAEDAGCAGCIMRRTVECALAVLPFPDLVLYYSCLIG